MQPNFAREASNTTKAYSNTSGVPASEDDSQEKGNDEGCETANTGAASGDRAAWLAAELAKRPARKRGRKAKVRDCPQDAALRWRPRWPLPRWPDINFLENLLYMRRTSFYGSEKMQRVVGACLAEASWHPSSVALRFVSAANRRPGLDHRREGAQAPEASDEEPPDSSHVAGAPQDAVQ